MMNRRRIVTVVALMAVLALALTPAAMAKSGAEKMASQLEKGSLDINTASLEELQMLPGVGEKTAESIQTYIKENGKIASAEDLMNISGIGVKKLMNIKPFLKF